jgi:hypothetical protein
LNEEEMKPIQKLKALIQMGLPFEQAYAQCWQDLVIEEKQNAPKYNMRDFEQSKINGSKGGQNNRPEKISESAKIINRMMKKNMKTLEIASMLGRQYKSIVETQKRYGLPREDID